MGCEGDALYERAEQAVERVGLLQLNEVRNIAPQMLLDVGRDAADVVFVVGGACG